MTDLTHGLAPSSDRSDSRASTRKSTTLTSGSHRIDFPSKVHKTVETYSEVDRASYAEKPDRRGSDATDATTV